MVAVDNMPLKKESEFYLLVIFVSPVLLFHLPIYFRSVRDGCVLITTAASFDKSPKRPVLPLPSLQLWSYHQVPFVSPFYTFYFVPFSPFCKRRGR